MESQGFGGRGHGQVQLQFVLNGPQGMGGPHNSQVKGGLLGHKGHPPPGGWHDMGGGEKRWVHAQGPCQQGCGLVS